MCLHLILFPHVNWDLLLSVWSEVLRKMNHQNYTSHFYTQHFLQYLCVSVCLAGGGAAHAPLCVVSARLPQSSLNQEGRSEKRLRSTTSVFLLCVRETPDGCLSCSHANAGPGTMATAGPHMQKAEVSRRAEEVIGYLMAITVVSWERPWLGPCAALDGQPAWECHLHSDDDSDTYDQRELFFFQLISCEGEADRNQHQMLVHTADRDTDIDAAW